MHELLTVKEVANELKLQVVTIREYIKSGKLKASRLNEKAFRISRGELNTFKKEILKEYKPG